MSSQPAASKAMESFAAATQVRRIDPNTYGLDFPLEWAIGTVPNGGFVTSCILAAASLHFRSTLKAQAQPDCMILHLDFPRRTSVGPASLTISDLKLGRQTSTVHVALSQQDRAEVVGYLTFANLAQESGITLPTAWTMSPDLPPVDFEKLARNADPNWQYTPSPHVDFRRASARVQLYYPRSGMAAVAGHGSLDHWLRFTSGEKFTTESLGLVSDVGLQITEGYVTEEAVLRQGGIDGIKGLGRLWYPTLVLNLELKKPLPDEGVEWLFTRVISKRVQNGRMDLEVFILDEQLELVALSHHVCMIVDASRNSAARGGGSKDKGKL